MKTHLPIALFTLSVLLTSSAIAGPKADALATCLGDNTSGKDRKTLATWIFLAMSAHPELKAVSNVTQQARDDADRAVGALVSRLLTEHCGKETREADSEGSQAMFTAFESLGGLAMQELTANAEVTKAIGGFERYLDKQKIEAVLKK